MAEKKLTPNYLFETSWEICNKVGGIHTSLSTKALTFENELKSNYMLLGPDVWRDEDASHPEFVEDVQLFKKWKDHALDTEGLRVRTGRWNIAGNPIAIIIDFTTYIPEKDDIFSSFWEDYKLDSLSGQWDYIEPALFGFAAGKTIESFVKFNLNPSEKVTAHFHEWLTGTGVLYLKKNLPQVGTVFTAHSTVLGRALASADRALYKNLKLFKPDEIAREYNLIAKHSLEKLSAHQADCFTTVSEITAKECQSLLSKNPNVLTPNGFEESLVPSSKTFVEKRSEAKNKLTQIAEALLGYKLSKDTLLVANGGKYEFKRKGIDVFVKAAGEINKASKTSKEIVAFILAPTSNFGPKKDLLSKMNGEHNNALEPFFTHGLHDHEHEFILNKLKEAGLKNAKEDKVKIIFISSYIDVTDGLFNLSYYDVLIGFDFTVFPSYYEPFGYIPLESVAYGIPTITSTLSGFGWWLKENKIEIGNAVTIIERADDDTKKATEQVLKGIQNFIALNKSDYEAASKKAMEIAGKAQWKNMAENYKNAYSIALNAVHERSALFVETSQTQVLPQTMTRPVVNDPIWKRLMVQSSLPEKLKCLEEITSNLWWTWDIEASEILETIHPELWEDCHHNPAILFEEVEYGRLLELEQDNDYVAKLNDVYHRFKAYLDDDDYKKTTPLIGYFSMEYGLHDSLKIYSGGLGLLAGDYLKEASDNKRNLVAIGLLYRYGYFRQYISIAGEQVSSYDYQHFSKLPIKPVKDQSGSFKTITIMLPGRVLKARIWEVNVGRTKLYLLDTDFEGNMEQDRFITHQLYGGDNENRLKQEMLLGIGGIRALNALGIKPLLYHSNEGHSAFIGLERLRKYINENNLSFDEAKEVVRSSTLFTTHTPVPAGHDQFHEDLLRTYVSHYPGRLKISWEQFMNLGKAHPDDPNEKFNMSHLAANLSQEVNGVSMLHGKVSQGMFAKLWKGYLPEELHLSYVTNGVHLPTWLAKDWRDLYFQMFGEDFYTNQLDKQRWAKIYDVPNEKIWEIKEKQRSMLIDYVKERYKDTWTQKHENPKLIMEITNAIDEKTLTIGFARRFATYKRAQLLFTNLERLAQILNNPNKPVQFLFAGKAHPHDKGGQALIKMIVEISKRPEFMGKIIFLQNYDICLAQRLVRGVDIWLNTPTRPLEASGTSGEKAVMNGSMHFSVLDGWWVEGYQKDAGWMLPEERTYENQQLQDELDAEMVYSIFENEIVPAFYDRNASGVPDEWVGFIKNTIAHVAPKFTTTRMIKDYYDRFYDKQTERTNALSAKDYSSARQIASWKKKIGRNWDNIKVISSVFSESSKEMYEVGKKYKAEVVLDTGNINPEELGVEVIITESKNNLIDKIEFKLCENDNKKAKYCADVTPTKPGSFNYGIRVFPKHEQLPHRQDMRHLKWV